MNCWLLSWATKRAVSIMNPEWTTLDSETLSNSDKSARASLSIIQVRWRRSGPSTQQPLLSCPTAWTRSRTTRRLAASCGRRTACTTTPGWTEHRRRLKLTWSSRWWLLLHPAQIPLQPLDCPRVWNLIGNAAFYGFEVQPPCLNFRFWSVNGSHICIWISLSLVVSLHADNFVFYSR